MTADIRLGLSEFASRTCCPGCHGSGASTLARRTTFSQFEHFPAGSVALCTDVEAARRLLVCEACGLWYFSLVPKTETITRLLDRPALSSRWSSVAGRGVFGPAHRALASYLPRQGRILNVVAHGGAFLGTLGPGWEKTAIGPMASASEEIGDTVLLRVFLEPQLSRAPSGVQPARDRVFHKAFPLRSKARGVAHLLMFCGLTLSGRRASLWRKAAGLTRSTSQASPPYTTILERDHIFVVARKR
jgi:hypothetical protein